MSSAVIALEGVHKRYRVYRQRYQSIKEILVHRRLGEWEDHWALRGIDLEVKPGLTLGLIGANGAGKSTLLKLMARILTPDRGRVRVSKRVCGLLELGAGFQPDYTGRENVYLNASLYGLTRKDIDRRFEAIREFSELEDAIDDPIRTYSSGMFMRLAFAIAIHIDPEVLLVDEILAVGDQSFQQKCLKRIGAFQASGGTIVLVSHSLGTIQEMCNQVAWIESGFLRKLGTPESVVNSYLDRVRERDVELEHDRSARSGEPPAPRPAVELREAQLLNRHGQRAGLIETGEALTVEIPYVVNRALQTPVFSVSLFRNDGVHVFTTNSTARRPAPLLRDGRVRLCIRDLPLAAGIYRITVALYGSPEASMPVDVHDRSYRIRVLGPSHEDGLIHLDHEWMADGEAGTELLQDDMG